MATVDIVQKTITCKIVYYGPAYSGKTTSLLYIHKFIPENQRSEIISLSTEGDRTLFFDFLALEAQLKDGFKVNFQLYAVPGQVHYNITRKLVLKGVDGIVFVADSQWNRQKENIESFENMLENLEENGYSLDNIPCVLQFNKRDLNDIAPKEYMDFLLNRRAKRVPSYLTIAIKGDGVFDTLNGISRLTLEKITSELS